MAWAMMTLDAEKELLMASAGRYPDKRYAGLVSCTIRAGFNSVSLEFTTVEQIERLARTLLESARELRGDTPAAGETDDVVDALPADGTLVKTASGRRGKVATVDGHCVVMVHTPSGDTVHPWEPGYWTPVS